MSKGYADYLCVLAREIDRDIQRELDGVEVPLFCAEFEEWLKTQLSESSQGNYMYWLRKADACICESDRDFWTLLKKAWDASDLETAGVLCDKYEKQLLKENEHAEKNGKEEFGESGKEIGNWVCAFRKYKEFHKEKMENAPADKKALAAMIEVSRNSADNLFLSEPFISWGKANGLSERTLNSYVDYIRRVNRELFSKTGFDVLYDFLPGYVKSKNAAKINEMFDAMEAKLTERIDYADETEMPVDSLVNGRAALKKYAEFIKSIITVE